MTNQLGSVLMVSSGAPLPNANVVSFVLRERVVLYSTLLYSSTVDHARGKQAT